MVNIHCKVITCIKHLILLVSIILLTVVYHSCKKQELVILEQKILRSQMNPHLIFNVLSSIQSSLLEKKTMISATYLAKFAKLMRQNFDYIKKKQIPIKDELDMIKNYLDTKKFRFKNKFDYEITIDENINLGTNIVPSMILQPFIDNAIKHGFANISYK